ncbi:MULTISPECIES: ABATE domain-containing protein [unclassified Streptomyces]|uniref:CGNR zinc finger domain-containing protein n=1 Tax=unclassified Streptomyces TaxID=2593676 RepID=UPI000DBAC1DD|nr:MULTISPECIES: ABATE domain-containing protein [unclassified Streptomyces]MYT72198.1 zf-CGNR multi-domain protein [Streptomyces sp. SID8367]
MVDTRTDPLAFRWYGGRVSVDFTATLTGQAPDTVEQLRTPADLSRWSRAAHLSDAPLPDATPRALTQAHQLREALHRTFLHAAKPDPDDLDTISTWSARSLPGPRLTSAPDDTPALRRPRLHLTGDLLTLIARDGVDLLTGRHSHRIRECAAPDCTLLFVDVSRPGRRRWCSMDVCGARSKMAGYRSRRTRDAQGTA